MSRCSAWERSFRRLPSACTPTTMRSSATKADLESMSRDDLYSHYRTFYTPNNAVLTMAGDFNTEAMLERIHDCMILSPPGRRCAWKPHSRATPIGGAANYS